MSRNRGDKEGRGRAFQGREKTHIKTLGMKKHGLMGWGGGGTKTTLKRLKHSKPGPGLWVNASKGGSTPVGLHLEW